MIRKVFKKKSSKNNKLDKFLDKYNIPREYLSINRKSVSRGVLVGLFWGFIPMPMQMVAVMATTPFLRFNVPLAISMVWLSNPFTMPPMYYMEYLTGNLILGHEGLSNIELTMDWFTKNMGDIFVPLYVGTAFYSIVVSSIIYLLINRLWIISVKSEKHRKEKERRERKAKEAGRKED
ncbi:MAG: flagellar biosynthesis protein FlhF [Epsilonproteobacteria bacterium (ex Lamellibrachia satsuma)]|nr:MAG: flagellar biosynthesis protein FlhF [Epsilonproteobacteria bacterium (ex Lamellibrachia satsuma)]